MGIFRRAFLNNVINPGLTSEQIIQVLQKKYGNKDFKNKSTADKVDVRFKSGTKTMLLSQKRGSNKLGVDSRWRFGLGFFVDTLMMGNRIGGQRFCDKQLLAHLDSEFEGAAKKGVANV